MKKVLYINGVDITSDVLMVDMSAYIAHEQYQKLHKS